jgi:ketosteroid isomerase-like protein
MTTTTTTSTAGREIAAGRERNEAVWRASSALLYAGRIDEFLGYWHEDASYEVAYPVGSFPALVEGRAALAELFAGFGAATERIAVHDVHFQQTDDPDVAFVEERMVAELLDGGRYENRLVIRVTFRDGLIVRMFEYYGERAHEELLRRLGLVS